MQTCCAERGQIKDCILQVPCKMESFTDQPMYLLTLNIKCYICGLTCVISSSVLENVITLSI